MSFTSQLPSLSLHQSGFIFYHVQPLLNCSSDFQETGHNVDMHTYLIIFLEGLPHLSFKLYWYSCTTETVCQHNSSQTAEQNCYLGHDGNSQTFVGVSFCLKLR